LQGIKRSYDSQLSKTGSFWGKLLEKFSIFFENTVAGAGTHASRTGLDTSTWSWNPFPRCCNPYPWSRTLIHKNIFVKLFMF